MKKILTIVIPTYNSLDALRNLLNNNNWDNYNIIVVDDCSEDGTYSEIKNIDWIKSYQTKTNAGSAGIPRMIGLKYTKTKYVYFLDADDLIDLEVLNEGLKKMVKEDLDLIKFNAVIQKGNLKTNLSNEMSFYFKNEPQVFESNNFMWTHLYKTSIIKDNSLIIRSGIAEDINFNYQYLEFVKSGYFLNKKLITYLKTDNGTSSRMTDINKYYLINNHLDTFKIFQYREYSEEFIEKMKLILINRNIIFNSYDKFSIEELNDILLKFNIKQSINEIIVRRTDFSIVKLNNRYILKKNGVDKVYQDYIILDDKGNRLFKDCPRRNSKYLTWNNGDKIKVIDTRLILKLRKKVGYIKRTIKRTIKRRLK